MMRGKWIFLLAGIAIAAGVALFFFQKGREEHDAFRKALATAAGAKKLVMLNFTGSGWCTGCMLLEKDVFEKPAYHKYAQDHLETVVVDFPLGVAADSETEKQNLRLQEKFRVPGFPMLILVDSRGQELARTNGLKIKGPQDFIDWVESVR